MTNPAQITNEMLNRLPEGPKRVYQLTDATVSPTRIAGMDEDGIPREETICPYGVVEKMMDGDGNILDVPLSNSRVNSRTSAEVRYGEELRAELMRAGHLPIAACPYAKDAEVRRIKGTATLVPVPKDAQACEGKADGCEHFHEVRASRQKKSRAKFDKQELATANAKQMELMAKSFGQGFAEANNAARNAGRKAGLVSGKGED